MILIDTCVLYAFYDQSDSCYEKARELLLKIPKDEILITADVMKELLTLTSMRKGNDLSKAIYKELDQDNATLYNLDTLELLEFITFFMNRPFNRLSTTDLQLIFLSQKHNFEVLTFDQELKNWLTPVESVD